MSTPIPFDPQLSLTAEVISIGDEMTSGARLDTNSQWLSRRLGELGVEVIFHSTVGDTLQHNIDVIRSAAMRADVVVCTGGLGPTQDDLTRQAIAAVVGQPLELRPSALDHIRSLFSQRGRDMPASNELQALFPVGSAEIFNPQGTAPGIDATIQRADGSTSRVFALPGVPAEMERMFDQTVARRILAIAGQRRHIEHHVMKFFGVGESEMELRLGDMIARQRVPRVGITVSAATISLRICAIAESAESCLQQIQSTRREILDRVGELHFGDGEEFEQYHATQAILLARGESMASVEFGHSATLANWFASLGPSAAYRGGYSAAGIDQLGSLLRVEREIALDTFRRRANAEWLLAVDEYPALECTDDQPHPAADVSLMVIDPNGKVFSTLCRLSGHPSILHARIGKAALAWLRQILNTEAAIAHTRSAAET